MTHSNKLSQVQISKNVDIRTLVLYTCVMHTLIKPDSITKLAQLGDATQFEPSGDQPLMERRRVPYQSHSLAECITNVSTPTGKKPILKAMLTIIQRGFNNG